MKNTDLAVLGLVLIVAGIGILVMSLLSFVDARIVELPLDESAEDGRPAYEALLLACGLVIVGLFCVSRFRVTAHRRPGERRNETERGLQYESGEDDPEAGDPR